jgi:ATP-dependent protease ClpP protease subunit
MTDDKKVKDCDKCKKGATKKRITKEQIRGYKVVDNEPGAFTIKRTKGDKEFEVYLSNSIGSQSGYHHLNCLLRGLTSKDKLTMYINNFGGYCHTGMQICNAISDSKGDITGVVDGAAYSMAPIIALACPKIELRPGSMLMFHDYKSMSGGSGYEQEAGMKASRIQFNTLLENFCTPFLTKKELSAIVKGKDTYIHHDEAAKRLLTHRP